MSINHDVLDRDPILPLDDENTEISNTKDDFDTPDLSETHFNAMNAAAQMLGISDIAQSPDSEQAQGSELPVGSALEAEAVRDISKLQALDYICMNTSRSAEKLGCAAKSGNVTAIKDNGSAPSFESIVPKHDERVGGMTALDDMLYIPSSLAAAMTALDADAFRQTLSESGLPEAEADAAKERLENLRERINESIVFSQNDPFPTVPVKGIIRVIDDDDDYWEELKKKRLNLVLDRYRYEMIRNAPQASDEYLRMIRRDFRAGMKMLEKMGCTAVSVNLFSDIHELISGFSDFLKDIANDGKAIYDKKYKENINKELSEIEAEFGDDVSESGEFANIKSDLRELINTVRRIQETEATDAERDKLRDMFSNVAEKARLYQECKPESEDAKHNKRFEAVGAIRKFSLCQYDFLEKAAKTENEESAEISDTYRKELEADIEKLEKSSDPRDIQQMQYARMAVEAHKYLSELAVKQKKLGSADRDNVCEAMACIMTYHMIGLQPENKRQYGQSDEMRKAQISEMLRNPVFKKSADRVDIRALRAFLAENGIQKACGRGLHEIGKAAKPAKEAKPAAKHPVREAGKQEIPAPVLKKDPPSSKG